MVKVKQQKSSCWYKKPVCFYNLVHLALRLTEAIIKKHIQPVFICVTTFLTSADVHHEQKVNFNNSGGNLFCRMPVFKNLVDILNIKRLQLNPQ